VQVAQPPPAPGDLPRSTFLRDPLAALWKAQSTQASERSCPMIFNLEVVASTKAPRSGPRHTHWGTATAWPLDSRTLHVRQQAVTRSTRWPRNSPNVRRPSPHYALVEHQIDVLGRCSSDPSGAQNRARSTAWWMVISDLSHSLLADKETSRCPIRRQCEMRIPLP
jgi:hypothetical protein